jgi:ABC-2 type transport system ATP-binding protein
MTDVTIGTPRDAACIHDVRDWARPPPGPYFRLMAEMVLEVNELRKEYGHVRAVDGVSFALHRGEILALLGTNGAGKTTTLDVLLGNVAPTAGRVRVLGADPRGERRLIAPRVGVMLQSAGFFDDLTVQETVDAWRRFTPGARERGEALQLGGLEAQARTRVGQLSGGERRRLDLCLALLGTPELLFLDEPTTGLDPEARRSCWRLLQRLNEAGTSILLTTHYMEEAEYLADTVAFLDHGQLVRQGTLAEVVSRGEAAISFRLPADIALSDLPPLADAAPHCERGVVHLRTPQPQPTLVRLLTWADARGVVLGDLRVDPGSLEDVFLDIAEKGEAVR